MKNKTRHLIGAHVSIAGGISKAPARAVAGGCTTLQVFTKSPNQWRSAPLSPDECAAFKAAVKEASLDPVVAHNAYLINLASPDSALWKGSIAAMVDEVERCHALGIGAIVTHPGSHMGSGEETGIRNAARALDRILRRTADTGVRILLETTAGQGRCLGGRFEHLAAIIALLEDRRRIGVCFDTCHVFAAGYDIRTPQAFEKVLKAFDRAIGLQRLALFHLNDSKGELGSMVDRHDHIGKGKIGPVLFRNLVRSRRFMKVPKIIETPGGVEGGSDDGTNLNVLFAFAGSSS